MSNAVDHPTHYGGKDNPYEAIKVIEAWNMNFNLGNTIKYISRAGKKDHIIQDLEKAKWYLEREINNLHKAEIEDDIRQAQIKEKNDKEADDDLPF